MTWAAVRAMLLGEPLETALTPTADPERPTTRWRTQRIVFFSFVLDILETAALAAAAALTGSSALVAQTFAAAASLAVQLFLIVGVLTSTRPPDASHPLGYGRERFFWAFYLGSAPSSPDSPSRSRRRSRAPYIRPR